MSKHNRERRMNRQQNAPVIYQVDIYGPYVNAYQGHLSNMVATNCVKCQTRLLAEGVAYRQSKALAKEHKRPFQPVCTPCFREITGYGGPLKRNLPFDEDHEQEIQEFLNQVRQ